MIDPKTTVELGLETAKGISEYGMLIVSAGFFLSVAAFMMVFFIKFMSRLVNNTMAQFKTIDATNDMIKEMKLNLEAQSKTVDSMSSFITEMRVMIEDVTDSMRAESLTKIQIISRSLFDNSKEEVCRMIKRVREENHIENREATTKKIRRQLQIIHDNRNSKFDSFSFRNKRLSCFTSLSWVDNVLEVVLSELYCEQGVNNGRMISNLKMTYDDIYREFNNNLMKEIK